MSTRLVAKFKKMKAISWTAKPRLSVFYPKDIWKQNFYLGHLPGKIVKYESRELLQRKTLFRIVNHIFSKIFLTPTWATAKDEFDEVPGPEGNSVSLGWTTRLTVERPSSLKFPPSPSVPVVAVERLPELLVVIDVSATGVVGIAIVFAKNAVPFPLIASETSIKSSSSTSSSSSSVSASSSSSA